VGTPRLDGKCGRITRLPQRVKLRRTQSEQMWSGLLPKAGSGGSTCDVAKVPGAAVNALSLHVEVDRRRLDSGVLRSQLLPLGDGGHRVRRRNFISFLGGVAGRRSRAAVGEAADHRLLRNDHTFGLVAMDRSICSATAGTWLDRGAHGQDRVSLGGRTR